MVTEEVRRCDIAELEQLYLQACRNSNQSLGKGDIYEIRDLVEVRDMAYRLIEMYRREASRLAATARHWAKEYAHLAEILDGVGEESK